MVSNLVSPDVTYYFWGTRNKKSAWSDCSKNDCDHKLHSRLPNNLYFLTGLKKVAIGNVAKKHDQSTDAHMYDLVKLTVRTQPGVA